MTNPTTPNGPAVNPYDKDPYHITEAELDALFKLPGIPNAVLAIIAEIRRLRAENERLRAENKRLSKIADDYWEENRP